MTPTASVQPVVEEIVNDDDDDVKKEDVISTSAADTPPVQEIRYQTNPYVNTGTPSVTPALSVMGYAPPPQTFSAPLDSSGTIYHTGVRTRDSIITFYYFVISMTMCQSNFNFSFVLSHFPSSLDNLFKNILKPDGTLYVLSSQPVMYSYATSTVCKTSQAH